MKTHRCKLCIFYFLSCGACRTIKWGTKSFVEDTSVLKSSEVYTWAYTKTWEKFPKTRAPCRKFPGPSNEILGLSAGAVFHRRFPVHATEISSVLPEISDRSWATVTFDSRHYVYPFTQSFTTSTFFLVNPKSETLSWAHSSLFALLLSISCKVCCKIFLSLSEWELVRLPATGWALEVFIESILGVRSLLFPGASKLVVCHGKSVLHQPHSKWP